MPFRFRLRPRRAPLARLAVALVFPALAISVLAGGVAAQGVPAGPRARGASVPIVAVRGVVLDPSGRPVDSAALRVRRASARGRSDAAGRFVLDRVAAGRIELEVERRGFVPLVLDLVVPRTGASEVQVILFPVDERVAAAPEGRAGDAGPIVAAPAAAPAATPAAKPAAATASDTAAGRAAVDRAATSPPAVEGDEREGGRLVVRRVAGRGLQGIVTDLAGRPLVGAQVALVRERLDAVTDAQGRFAFPGVQAGASLVRVRRVGHAPRAFPLSLAADSATEVAVALETTAQRLARVEVRADAGRLRTFEERRARGFGQFATRDQFLLRAPVRPSDALTGFAGIVVLPDASGRRQVYGRGRCRMPLFVDGVFTPIDNGLSIDDVLSINDIEAIEVHTGAGGLPAELALRSENCGAVVMWTRGARRDR